MGQSLGWGLTAPTLVLNKSWVPISTTTVRHAINLAIKDSARLIQPDTYQVHDFESWCTLSPLPEGGAIRTPNLIIRLPEVIVLMAYNKIPGNKVPFSRRNVYRRDGNLCQYCGRHVHHSEMTIDHVVPRSVGGKNTWENCVIACRRCNNAKGDKALSECGLRLLRRPTQPDWSPCITTRKGQRCQSWRGFVSEKQWAMGFGG